MFARITFDQKFDRTNQSISNTKISIKSNWWIRRKKDETMMKEFLDVQQVSLIVSNQPMEENDDEMKNLILMNQIEVLMMKNSLKNFFDIHQDENDHLSFHWWYKFLRCSTFSFCWFVVRMNLFDHLFHRIVSHQWFCQLSIFFSHQEHRNRMNNNEVKDTKLLFWL